MPAGKEETIWAAAGVLRAWIESYGVPRALYTDWKNVYVRPANAQERVRGEEPQTQFGRMCQQLGIQIIAANSAQAKGRVERNHGTHQDRLVKKLRRKQAKTHAEVNQYLAAEYCQQHNAHFAQEAAAPEDYHLPSPGGKRLGEILRLESQRVLSNDWVVQYEGRLLQVERQSQHYAPAKSKVTVWEDQYGRLEFCYRGEKLKWKEIPERPAPASTAGLAPGRPRASKLGKWRPAADHPWRHAGRRVRKTLTLSSPGVGSPSLASASAAP